MVREDRVWLVNVFGGEYYVPRQLTRERIIEAGRQLAPVSDDTSEIRLALFRLWLTTKHEKMHEDDRDALILEYVRRLSIYPSEIVELVLHEISQKLAFWPAWAEIAAHAQNYMTPRTRLLDALRLHLGTISAR